MAPPPVSDRPGRARPSTNVDATARILGRSSPAAATAVRLRSFAAGRKLHPGQ